MQSPFQSILHTNAVPSDTECQRIRDLLVGPRQRAADLTKEIEEMQIVLDRLERRREELDRFIDAHLSLVSPARRLPEDVIRAIFTACMPSAHNAVMSPTQSPLLLCQICSDWRYIALSTPELWASLHIVVPTSSRINDVASAITTWLSRSGVLPLSISLFVSKRCQFRLVEDFKSDSAPLLASIDAFSLRWKHIILPAFPEVDIHAHPSSEDLPMLHTLTVGSSLFYRWPASLKYLPITASNLRSLSISSGFNLPNLPLPWFQLTHLRISNEEHASDVQLHFPTCDALVVLRRCPALETCELHVGDHENWHPTFAPVTLPHLWHFDISSRSFSTAAEDFFMKLLLPNLRSFRYSSLTGPQPSQLFIPSLEYMSLKINELQSIHLLEALRHMALLIELEVFFEPKLPGSSDRDADFLGHFKPGPEDVLCPNLQCLQLFEFSAVSDHALLRFIQARAGPAQRAFVPLTYVSVQLDREMEWDILPSLQSLIDANELEVWLDYRCSDPPEPYSPWEGIEVDNDDMCV
ncbi:hypothetical protein C8R44DRAFT_767318 [Mycena epipterygia]|nr:hypothetical protein C8R44DRAFT_767318 [Mycena epipterygia]